MATNCATRCFSAQMAGQPMNPSSSIGPNKALTYPRAQFRGTTHGRFKVLVEDGAHTKEDVSDGDFTVTANPLRAEILNPANNSTFLAGQDLLLHGHAGIPSAETIDDRATTSGRISELLAAILDGSA